MKDSIESLLRHRKTFSSQTGEDGVLEYILSQIPDKNLWCVEFGAWDGQLFSNTNYFITKMGYHGIMIEADTSKYEMLKNNMKGYDAICVSSYVEIEGNNSLDAILGKYPIPANFDLLSVDIDGNDYFIWQSLKNYQPKVVIMEINRYCKPGVKKINEPSLPSGATGTSISSMTILAKSKGYSLLAQVCANAIYVKDEYRGLFHDREVTPEEVFTYEGFSLLNLSFDEISHLGFVRVLKRVWKSFCSRLLSANKS